MAAILLTFSNAFSWMKLWEFGSIKTSLKIVLWGLVNNIPTLVQIMGWRRPSVKPLSEPMIVGLYTHIGATRPQWVRWRTKNPDQFRTTTKQKKKRILRAWISLIWRHNGRDGVSNHQPHDCLLNRLFRSSRWIPRTNGQQRGKCFHLMTSSC